MQATGYESRRVEIPEIDDAVTAPLHVELRPRDVEEPPPLASARLLDGEQPLPRVLVELVLPSKARRDAVNGRVHRGVAIPDHCHSLGSAVTDEAGSFRIPMSREFPDRVRERPLFLRVHRGQGRIDLLGAFVSRDGTLSGDLAIPRSGAGIRGRVRGLPVSAAGRCHAVLFNRDGLLAECRIEGDAAFEFANLPPGDYAVRIGTEVFETQRVWVAGMPEPDGDPWKDIDPLRLAPGELGQVELPYPGTE